MKVLVVGERKIIYDTAMVSRSEEVLQVKIDFVVIISILHAKPCIIGGMTYDSKVFYFSLVFVYLLILFKKCK